MRLRFALGICWLGLAAESPGQEILVSGFNSGEVHRFDFATGDSLGPLATVNQPQGIAYGPDGLLYIAVEGDDKVVRVDPALAPATRTSTMDGDRDR